MVFDVSHREIHAFAVNIPKINTMQLKMEKKKKFNRQDVRNKLEKESKFIGNLLSVSQIPSHGES